MNHPTASPPSTEPPQQPMKEEQVHPMTTNTTTTIPPTGIVFPTVHPTAPAPVSTVIPPMSTTMSQSPLSAQSSCHPMATTSAPMIHSATMFPTTNTNQQTLGNLNTTTTSASTPALSSSSGRALIPSFTSAINPPPVTNLNSTAGNNKMIIENHNNNSTTSPHAQQHTAPRPNPPSYTHPLPTTPTAPDMGMQRELKVEDALCYLDQVKHVFSDQQGIYNQFLDIMKNFKSHMIDTPGVIERVSSLFKGHPKLITGFNTFLPQGFKIGEDLTYTVPGDHQPHHTSAMKSMDSSSSSATVYHNESTPVSINQPGIRYEQQHHQQGFSGGPSRMEQSSSYHYQPYIQHSQDPHHGMNTNNSNYPMNMNTNLMHRGGMDLSASGSSSSLPMMTSSTAGAGAGAGPIGAPSSSTSGVNPTAAQPVEFDHAITYVTRIKKRFSDEPDTYKAFLEILHTYQKEQRSIKQVLDQVSHLFRDHEDLLQEFTYFLPDNAQEQAKDRLNRAAEKAIERKRLKRLKQQEKKDEKNRQNRENNQLNSSNSRVMMSGSKRGGPSSMEFSDRREKDRERQKLRYHEKKAKKRSYDDKERRDRFAFEESNVLPSEWHFFDRAKKVLPSRESWREFMKCLDLYSQEVVGKEEMMALVQNLFGRHQDLISDFKVMLNQHGGHDSQSDIWFSMPLAEIDFSRCRRCTPSYRALPSSYPNPPCSSRSELEKSVCNDAWVSVPTGSEDFSFKNMRKNQYEEALFKCEDERFEIDMIIDANACTIRILEPLAKEIACLRQKQQELDHFQENGDSPVEQWQYRLDRRTLGAIHLNSISRVYGDSGVDILEVLRKHPAGAIPVILERLKQKDGEWRRARKELNKQWKDTNEKNFHKSLDHCSFYFKQQDKKQLSAKGLVNEAKEHLEKQQSATPESESSTSSKWGYHFSFEFPDPSIHKQAYAILNFATEQSCSSADKVRIAKLWKQYLLPFLNLPDDWLMVKPEWKKLVNTSASVLESGTEVLTPYGLGTVESYRDHDRSYFVTLAFGHGYFQPDALQVKENNEFPPNLCASDDTKYCQVEQKDKLSSEHVRLCYDGQAFYLFLRLYQVLYHRLSEARNLCARAKRNYRKITFNPAASALSAHHVDDDDEDDLEDQIKAGDSDQSEQQSSQISNKKKSGQKEQAGDYDAFISHVYGLVEGTIENTRFEDICRNLMGSSSFFLFTMDKLIAQLLKQLQNLGSDEPTEFQKLFHEENLRSTNRGQISSEYLTKCKPIFDGEDAYRVQFNCGILRQTPLEPLLPLPVAEQGPAKIWAPSPRVRQFQPSPWLVKPTLYIEYLGSLDDQEDDDEEENQDEETKESAIPNELTAKNDKKMDPSDEDSKDSINGEDITAKTTLAVDNNDDNEVEDSSNHKKRPREISDDKEEEHEPLHQRSKTESSKKPSTMGVESVQMEEE